MKGVKDLLSEKRFQTRHVKEKLVEIGVPGQWDNYQNIYNLIDAHVKPQDPVIYLMFSEMLDISITDVMSRYSNFDLSNYKTDEPSSEETEGSEINNKYSNW